jgi:hypothetical protein
MCSMPWIRAYKRECWSRLSLSQLHHIVQAKAPVKNKKLITLSIVNSKLVHIFLSKDLLCIVCTFNTLVLAEVVYTLTTKEAILLLCFTIYIIIMSGHGSPP